MADNKSVFADLFAVNCNEHTEKKNGLTYLSWAFSWAEVKKRYPLAFYKVYENENGRPYFDDGRTCWVKTGVTIEGLEHVEYLPIMDYRNASIPVDKVTSMDMNKAIQRSLTKACARHGLGLYIYAGEDLPEGEPEPEPAPVKKATRKKAEPAPEPEQKPEQKPEQTKLHVAADNVEMILRIARWAVSSPARIDKARAGYDWEPGAIAAFEKKIYELNTTQS